MTSLKVPALLSWMNAWSKDAWRIKPLTGPGLKVVSEHSSGAEGQLAAGPESACLAEGTLIAGPKVNACFGLGISSGTPM